MEKLLCVCVAVLFVVVLVGCSHAPVGVVVLSASAESATECKK